MTQPSSSCARVETLLPWFLNGSLEAEERETVRAHVAGCDACLAELEETRAAVDIFNQHLPVEILEKLALTENGQTAAMDALVKQHLEACDACRDEVALMKASWRELAEQPDLQAPRPKSSLNYGMYRWGLALAAVLVVGLGLGWYQTYLGMPQVPVVGELKPQSNLIAKDLFPVELARRSDAGASVPLFDGFSGIALTLHSQMESPSFELEIRDDGDAVLWTASQVLAQENGTLSILVPASLIQGKTLSILLTAVNGREEHYRLAPQSE